ncbi:REP element-mobilizing transposase RayT [Lacibacter cauensis]|uniref:REP element-mobilizing transposase RayT n=2 Tax=Lacibacter cauensis TaxID=510947 RepID=A0A562SD41_9BACT|nr:REP element-mobilizing transposase RayT [Lacibacter cauensis]
MSDLFLLLMKFEPDHIYHVFNQGNNKQQLFHTRDDYKKFISFIRDYILPYADIVSWCLLPNHFHIMLVAKFDSGEFVKSGNLRFDPLTNGVRKLISGYSHYFNDKYNRSGALFRPKTKAKDLSDERLRFKEEDYLLNCFYYILQNPLRHGLVKDLAEWEFSAFRFYAGLREHDFCSKEIVRLVCEYDEKRFPELVMGRMPDYLLDDY